MSPALAGEVPWVDEAGADCDVCCNPVPRDVDLQGCADCSRLYGPCCASDWEEPTCCDCVKGPHEPCDEDVPWE